MAVRKKNFTFASLSLSFLSLLSGLVSFASRVFHCIFAIWRDELFSHSSVILETCIKVKIVYLHCVAAEVILYFTYTCTCASLLCIIWEQHKKNPHTRRHTHANYDREVAIGSNTCISRNSGINIPLTIHFIVRSLRSCSPFSIQGPFMGLIFPSHQATLIKKHT